MITCWENTIDHHDNWRTAPWLALVINLNQQIPLWSTNRFLYSAPPPPPPPPPHKPQTKNSITQITFNVQPATGMLLLGKCIEIRGVTDRKNIHWMHFEATFCGIVDVRRVLVLWRRFLLIKCSSSTWADIEKNIQTLGHLLDGTNNILPSYHIHESSDKISTCTLIRCGGPTCEYTNRHRWYRQTPLIPTECETHWQHAHQTPIIQPIICMPWCLHEYLLFRLPNALPRGHSR